MKEIKLKMSLLQIVQNPPNAPQELTSTTLLIFHCSLHNHIASLFSNCVSWTRRIDGFSCLMRSLSGYDFVLLPIPLQFQGTLCITYMYFLVPPHGLGVKLQGSLGFSLQIQEISL